MALLVIAAAGIIFRRHLPTAGHDVALEPAGAATGVLLGVLATALTRIRRDHADAAIITAGLMFAALWIIVIGGRRFRRQLELSLPPKLTHGQLKGFTLYATRTILSGGGDELVELTKTNMRELGVESPAGASDDLLAAVDVVRGAGESGVGHEVHGERGHVGGPDHAPDGERGPELSPAGVELIAEQRGRQRRVDEPGGDEVDPDRCELERHVGGEGGERGGFYRRDRFARARAPVAGAGHEHQRAAGAHLSGGVPAVPPRAGTTRASPALTATPALRARPAGDAEQAAQRSDRRR